MYQFRNRDESNRLNSDEKPNEGTVPPARGVQNSSSGTPFARTSPVDSGFFATSAASIPGSFLAPRSAVAGSLSSSPAPAPPSAEAMVEGFRLLGMTPREARVYLALRDASRGAREATQRAGLHRATGYRVLQRLLDRGLITGDGRKPQRYRAVDPAILFRRLELFYRDETEIPNFLAGSFGSKASVDSLSFVPGDGFAHPVRILVAEGRGTHPALAELGHARHTLSVVVRPLATPVAFRGSLARLLGKLARSGVQIRLVCDATPADHRFCAAMLREAKGAPTPIHVRHYSPVASNFFSIDRQRVIRLATLGVSNRKPPVGISIEETSSVRALVSRFEALWSEALAA
jgi:hypothetical protein